MKTIMERFDEIMKQAEALKAMLRDFSGGDPDYIPGYDDGESQLGEPRD
jgi:hypothetical protein